jgi:hypothetical protein
MPEAEAGAAAEAPCLQVRSALTLLPSAAIASIMLISHPRSRSRWVAPSIH